MKSAHQMSSAAIKLDEPTPTSGLWPEEDYSAFYKQQLYLAVLDDFAAFSGGIHKYADHIIRKLLIAHRRGQLIDFEMSWVDSAEQTHLFHGRNLRNFMAGKNSTHAIWAVLDLYIKLTQSLISKGFQLEGYLERLGFCVADYIQPINATEALSLKATGLYSAKLENGSKLYLDIEELKDRRFALVHLVTVSNYDDIEQVTIKGLQDHRTRIDKGICVPQLQNDILIIRDTETADASFGFLKTEGDSIRFHRILVEGGTEMHILRPDENTKISQIIKAASFKEEY